MVDRVRAVGAKEARHEARNDLESAKKEAQSRMMTKTRERRAALQVAADKLRPVLEEFIAQDYALGQVM